MTSITVLRCDVKKNNEFNIFIAEHKNYHDFKKYCSGRSSKTKYSLNSWNMTEAIFKTKIIPFWFIIPFLSQERNSIKSWFKKQIQWMKDNYGLVRK